MKDKLKAATKSDSRHEDLLHKIGQYACLANNRLIMHDFNNLTTSLFLQHSLCDSALQAGDYQKVSDRLTKMERLISKQEVFAKALPKQIQITLASSRGRIDDIVADALEFINTYPSLRKCQFELDLGTNDIYYQVDKCFLQVMIVALTRQAVLSFRKPRVIISCKIVPKSNAGNLRVEAQDQANPETGLKNELEDTSADFIFENIPLRSLQRIALELHPSLNLELSEPTSWAFSCQLDKAKNQNIG